MEHRKIYVLDASVFITARRTYYGLDFCPGFWQALLYHHRFGDLLSIDKIEEEILEGTDELRDWVANDVPAGFFVTSSEPDILHSYTQIIDWVDQNPQYTQAAKNEYADDPDGWLVAYAHAKDCVVVTQEVLDPNIRRGIPIPNVCDAFGVECINTFDMLRALGVTFVCDNIAPF